MTKTYKPLSRKQEVLSFVLATAVEGGINYWANDTTEDGALQVKSIERDENGDYRSITFVRAAVEEVSGAKVLATFPAGDLVVLDLAALQRGLRAIFGGQVTWGGKPLEPGSRLRKLAVGLTFCDSNDDAPDYDAGDADNLVQAALFGDVVYG